MISIICVFNDENILNLNLLDSIKNQDTKYELILVDNRKNQFKSLTEALNHGGKKGNGDYLLFVHQDVKLDGNSWLNKAENILNSIDKIGIVGVAGIDKKNNPIGFINDRGRYWGYPLKKPIKVQTIDELLFIIPKNVFDLDNFDEDLKWHSYASEYCLRILSKGLKTYILPLYVSHNSITLPILKAGSLKNDDLVLWKKYKSELSVIYKTTAKIELEKKNSMKILRKLSLLMNKLSFNMKNHQIFNFFQDSKRIIDLIVPIEQPNYKNYFNNSINSVGVSEKYEHIIISKHLSIHKNYILSSWEYLPFRNKVFDGVILRSFLEYLSKDIALKMLKESERIVRKIILFFPNNGYPRTRAYKLYGSIWNITELKKDGYSIYGIKPKRFFKNKLLTLIEPFLDILCWRIPCLSGYIMAIKDK